MEQNTDARRLEEKIIELISERLDSGGKLPTEKQMVEEFGVSRPALREVLSIFEASGVITTLQGSGRYVKMPNVSAQLADTWAILIRAKPQILTELLEIRAILEISALAKVVERVTVSQLQELGQQVAAMKDKASRNEDFVAEDRQFHRILFDATGNELLEQLMSAFWDLYAKSSVEPQHDDLAEVAEHHRKMLDALTKRDLGLLTQLMKEQFADARYRIVVSLINEPAASHGASSS